MPCKRCAEDPQPVGYTTPRKCAFDEHDVFTPDNFSCATMILLWDHCQEDSFHADDERVRCFYCDLGEYFGIITLQRYKWRGRVQGAIVFDTSLGGTRKLTLALAERALLE